MTSKIVIVEDDEAITTLLNYNLAAEGFDVVVVRSGDQALSVIAQERPGLVVLDWMLPGISGVEICRLLRARAQTRDVPVIMLTARAAQQDKLQAFDAGADDYVVKPFSVSELVARINGLLRRAGSVRNSSLTVAGHLQIDTLAHQVLYRGQVVALSPVEYKLLECLVENRNRVQSRAQLIERIWDNASDVNERTVDIHISHLRQSLAAAGAPDCIATVRGIGYVLSLDQQ